MYSVTRIKTVCGRLAFYSRRTTLRSDETELRGNTILISSSPVAATCLIGIYRGRVLTTMSLGLRRASKASQSHVEEPGIRHDAAPYRARATGPPEPVFLVPMLGAMPEEQLPPKIGEE